MSKGRRSRGEDEEIPKHALEGAPMEQTAEAWRPEERPRMGEHYHEAFQHHSGGPAKAEDGLPTLKAPMPTDTEAPPLLLKQFVCAGDMSSFVLRDGFGEILCSFHSEEVTRTESGRYRAPLALTKERLSLWFKGTEKAIRDFRGSDVPVTVDIAELLGHVARTRMATGEGHGLIIERDGVEVFPVREQCRFYARQMSEESGEMRSVHRLCTARRDSEGLFMAINDMMILACELRRPGAGNKVEMLDAFDAKVDADAQRFLEESRPLDFDVEEAADIERNPGGIFR